MVAGLAWIDAPTTTAFTASSGAVAPAGARLPGTTRWQSTLPGEPRLRRPGIIGGARLVVTHSHVGPRALAIEGASAASGYSLFDLRVAFTRGPWELSASVGNVVDSRGVGGASVLNRPGIARYTDYYLVKPRHAGVALRHDH